MASLKEDLEAGVAKVSKRAEPGYGPGMREVPLNVSTRTGEIDPETGKQKSVGKEFRAYLPGDLDTAVKVLGEKVVHRYFINALVVDLQSEERATLVAAQPGEGRKKAKYLEELGL